MNAETQEVLTSLYSYIRNYALSDSQSFIRNLRVIKSNTDLEWFNCALIAQQKRIGAEHAVVVNTIEGWEYIMEIEGLKIRNDSIKPLCLLSPVYFEEENYLTFNLLDVYYLDDFEPISNRSYTRMSAIGQVLQEYKKEYPSLLHLLKEGWQETFLQKYLMLFDFYRKAEKNMQTFYMQSLKMVFGKELHIKGDKIVSIPDLKKNDALSVYKNLHECIVSFHIAYASYLSALCSIDRQILLEPEVKTKQSPGYQRILAMSGEINKGEREESL